MEGEGEVGSDGGKVTLTDDVTRRLAAVNMDWDNIRVRGRPEEQQHSWLEVSFS